MGRWPTVPCRMKMGYLVRASARTRRRHEGYRESARKLMRELPAPRLGTSEPADQDRHADAPASAGITGPRRRRQGASVGLPRLALVSDDHAQGVEQPRRSISSPPLATMPN